MPTADQWGVRNDSKHRRRISWIRSHVHRFERAQGDI